MRVIASLLRVIFCLDSSLSELMQYLNSGIEFSPFPKTTDNVKVGQACLGKFSQDGLWYRVEITKIENKTEISVSVSLVKVIPPKLYSTLTVRDFCGTSINCGISFVVSILVFAFE